MENAPGAQALDAARRFQPLACLALIAGVALSAAGLERVVHSDALGRRLDAAWTRVNDTANEYSRVFRDTEDRIVLQDLAELDPSKGGVYFFGSSNMKWAMRVPDLPADQRRLVHDFGGGEGSPYFERQFTQFLVDRKNILGADPGKTLIVYGACFINAKQFPDAPTTVFTNMWRRYGLYRYDARTGIAPRSFGPDWDEYALEKARGSSFVHMLIDRGGRLIVPKSMRRRNTTHDAAVYAADYKARMGPDWQAAMDRHFEELQDWYDYVHARGARFEIVLLPLASWHRPLPYTSRYDAMVRAFCAKNRVPLVDLSALLSDDDFLDHIHANAQGLPKTDAALMSLAKGFLVKTGAWPGPRVRPSAATADR